MPSLERSDARAVRDLDSMSKAIYLEVPGSKVVLLQAYFELYEGLGVVRTIDGESSLLCIITPNDQLEACMSALESLYETTHWRFAVGFEGCEVLIQD